MANKRKIGCFQFWFGVFLLVVAVTGTITSIITYNHAKEDLLRNNLKLPEDLSEQETVQAIQMTITMREIGFTISASLVFSIALASLITFLMSILFITQGLINKPEVKK